MDNITFNITGRGSDKHAEKSTEDILLPVILSVMAILACIANGIVVFLFFRRPRLRTAPNYFLFSLSISDLSAGLLFIPLGLARHEYAAGHKRQEYIDPDILFDLQTAFFFMEGFIAFSTAYHVTLTTLDRFVAIVFPLKHYLLTKRTAKMIVVSLWVLALSLASIQLHWHLTRDIKVIKKQTLWWDIFRLVLVFVLPYPVMIYAFIRIFMVIFKGRDKNLTEPICRSSRRTQQQKNELKPVVMFLLMALLFAACWLPWSLVMTSPLSLNLSKAESLSLLTVHFLTPITNPLLYTFLKHDFKTALKQTLNLIPKNHNKKAPYLRQTENLQSSQANGHLLHETAL